MATLKLYRDETVMLSKEEIVEKRKELFKFINGDAFFPLSSWPRDMQLIFWKRPISDEESFKLLLFFIGNGEGAHVDLKVVHARPVLGRITAKG